MKTQVLSHKALQQIIGIKRDIPMTPCEMARSLRVAFFPSSTSSQRLCSFLHELKGALRVWGAEVVSYEQAMAEGTNDRIGEGIVLFAPGEGEPGNLAIDHVASLTNNSVIAVLDGTLRDLRESLLQRRVDALIGALVWHMAQTVIYVDELSWTVCTMNGGIDTFGLQSIRDRVLDSLIPKIAAPVVPPQKEDLDYRENAFDPFEPKYSLSVHDLLTGSEIWGRSGLLASQTKLKDLAFRNPKYRRIASVYLNHRTGMSYGFLARQLPMRVSPAMNLAEADSMLQRLDWDEKDFVEIDGTMVVAPQLGDQRFIVRVPEIVVLCTRSGCEKVRLEPATDLVTLTLSNGRVQLGTPSGLPAGSDCQPSFDTFTIVSHAVGNAIIASILYRLNHESNFVRSLTHKGLAIAHWHGYPALHSLPKGYHLHGHLNPPVSCSTSQAAIFSLSGKLEAFALSIETGADYLGDVHVEPSHGTNLSGPSLTDLAELAVSL